MMLVVVVKSFFILRLRHLSLYWYIVVS